MPLLHSDTGVLDRWLWLRQRLPQVNDGQNLIDIGCGSGAFTIGAALRGYNATGLSWDERNQAVAIERAKLCNAEKIEFQIQDIRHLDKREDLKEKFDVVICCEAIEHIIDDTKLMRDIAGCLAPGGKLLLTTPNFYLKPIDPEHEGPFPIVEDGGHVRKGYKKEDLLRLCDESGLIANEISYCMGVLSQKITRVYFVSKKAHPVFAWGLINPFRVIPLLFDSAVTKITKYPHYSICLEASKPK